MKEQVEKPLDMMNSVNWPYECELFSSDIPFSYDYGSILDHLRDLIEVLVLKRYTLISNNNHLFYIHWIYSVL